MARSARRAAAVLGGVLAFALLATLNSGGYRYGASDQAFYIPAIERHLNPALFPRDAVLIDSQSRLFVLDELLAALDRTLHVGLPALFLTGYALTLGLLFIALVALGRAYFESSWSVAALVAAASLRHRIAKTGANTLEGYFHPRLLAFAIGLAALNAVLRGRTWWALVFVLLAGLVHPTTAVWFAIWIGVAVAVDDPRARPVLLGVAGPVLLAGGAFLWLGPLGLTVMDSAWVATLADKDYVFPTGWAAGTWALNLLSPIIVGAAFLVRRRRGLVRAREAGVVAGCLVLVAIFLVSLPFIAARIALVVQLQVSRVFWMADLLATIYVVWAACESRRAPAAAQARTRARLVAVAVTLLALVRGVYVLRVEHPGRPLIQSALPSDEWMEASAWLRRTPVDTHVLADGGHAWRYGTSLRVSAKRDVFLEDVKDGSIGMYDRGVALRVAERRAALGDFAALTPERLHQLAARYDLQYLVTEQRLPLPEVHRNARFFIYRLTP